MWPHLPRYTMDEVIKQMVRQIAFEIRATDDYLKRLDEAKTQKETDDLNKFLYGSTRVKGELIDALIQLLIVKYNV